MLIDTVERTLWVTSMLSTVLSACGHSPFTLGWKHTLANSLRDPRGTLRPLVASGSCFGGWLTSGLIFLPPECHYPPLTLDAERMYSYCHWTIGPPQGQVQPAA